MRIIYLQVTNVIVWLGEDQNGDAEELLKHYESLEAAALLVSHLSTYERRLSALFDRLWWTRYWILQEVIHQKPVVAHIGSYKIDFDDLCDRISIYHLQIYLWKKRRAEKSVVNQQSPTLRSYAYMLYLDSTTYTLPGTILMQRQRSRAELGFSTLEHCLTLFRDQKCSDPRDKVFAMLGLIYPDAAAEITVDYKASKRLVYTQVMRHLLSEQPSEALLLVQSPNREISSTPLPSWVCIVETFKLIICY